MTLDKREAAKPDHEATPQSSGSNPLASSTSITVSVPESVNVKLVDASALADYEIWLLLTSISSSGAIGFLVATVQASAEQRDPFMWFTIILLLLFGVFGAKTIHSRLRLRRRAKHVRFNIGDPLEDA